MRCLFLVLLVAAAGCTDDSADRSSNGSNAENQTLDWYLGSAAQTRTTLYNASATLLTKCLQAHGYSTVVPTHPAPSFTDRSVRYGIDSLTRAEQYGYSDPAAVEAASYPQPSYPENDPQFATVLGQTAGDPVAVSSPVDGKPIGSVFRSMGCNEEVLRTLYGSFDRYVEYSSFDLWLQTAASDALSVAKSDPVVEAATRRWSACMASSGYELAGPDAASQFSWPDIEAARRAAKADFECRRQSRYIEVLEAADARAQHTVLDGHPDLAERYQTLLRPILDAAATAMKSNG